MAFEALSTDELFAQAATKVETLPRENLLKKTFLKVVENKPALTDAELAKFTSLEIIQNVLAHELCATRDSLIGILEAPSTVGWNDAKGNERSNLIDKDLEGTATDADRERLAALTEELRLYTNVMAPLQMEHPRKLLDRLLAETGRTMEDVQASVERTFAEREAAKNQASQG